MIKLATDQNFLAHGFGKWLDKTQGQSEFLKEILTLACYKHKNIICLLGFCDEDDEKILVYKYEVNGSLDRHLADTNLTWEDRLRICLDAARGLKYLHDDVGVGHRVIHRDIKSSNILLDEDWKAKISDFGLCKIGLRNEWFSFLVSNIAGTIGYVDPQYIETGVLTKESDVYAFGVVLCEVLCGRPAVIAKYCNKRTFLPLLLQHHYEDKNTEGIFFANLQGNMKPRSCDTFLNIAYNCVNKDRRHSPTMEIVVKELEAALEHQTAITLIGKRTRLWGSSSGGDVWSFMLKKNQKLSKITIDSHTWIHSISFTKKDLDDKLHYSQIHGGSQDKNSGRVSEINFDDGEEITGISVTTGKYYGLELVSSVRFMTNKREYGPFGYETRSCFSKSWEAGLFGRLYGRCGWELDAIGCCFMIRSSFP
ncbi:putative serine/threonine-protein kinase PBL28 [Bidens hawaiensis]|uniref:putative serine/threonine-protein kinase PBL28 n=1 Tax=Bidens hawaiensis TaxID=980011 RepID=UPI004049116C